MMRGIPQFPLKFDLKMKITTFLVIVAMFNIHANNYAQNTKITLDLDNVTIERALIEIESLTDFKFFFSREDLDVNKAISIKANRKIIKNILEEIFQNLPVSFEVLDKQIILKAKKQRNIILFPVKEEEKQQKEISGTVSDENGGALPGASILIKGTNTGTTTDIDGKFSLTIEDKSSILVVSFMGFKSKEIAIGEQSTFNIQLEEDSSQLDEVVLTGVRSSLSKAIALKRTSVGVSDGIAAKDIADMPDLNISESLQRITGVTINRVLGEGQQVSVRGLSPEFTRVTINGQTVASGNPGREVDFDVFASELFNNVQLLKSPDASLTEGGLAATINLKTARPFDYSSEKPIFALSAQGVVNDLRDEFSPRLSFLASNNRFMNGKLGLLGSVSYSESKLRQDNVEGLRFLLIPKLDVQGNGTVDYTNVEIPFIPRYLLELLDRDRLGLTGAIQYRPTDAVDFSLDIAYAKFNEIRTRHSIDGLLNGNRSNPIEAFVDDTGLVTDATYDNVSSRSENVKTPTTEDLLLLNFDSAFRLKNNLVVNGKIGYSKASKESREFRAVYNFIDRFSYSFNDRIFVGLHPENKDFSNPNDFVHNQSRFINDDIDDKEFSTQIDVVKRFNDGFINSIKGGLRFSDREKSLIRFDGSFTAKDENGVPLPVSNAIASTLPVDDFFGGYNSPNIIRNWFVTDFDSVTADPAISGANFTIPQRYISTFSIDEKAIAGYLQSDFRGQIGNLPIRGNLGVRLVSTDQTSNGYLGDGTLVSINQTYMKFLPSLNTVFDLSENMLLRIAASKSMTRPTLYQLSPGGTVAPGNAVPVTGGGTANLGNPELNPFTATQFDISWEWYFSKEGLASLTLFNKNVDNFIVPHTTVRTINVGSLVNDNGQEVGDAPFNVTQPVNGDGATIKGFELSLQLPFTFLPKPLDGLGTVLNYTYSDSESEYTFNGETIKTLLPGQAKSSFNIIGYFEKGPFSTRLAYSWRDKILYEVRPTNERSNFIEAYGQLDGNIQYNISKNIILTFDALNISGKENYRYAETTDRNIAYSNTGRFYTFGVRAKF